MFGASGTPYPSYGGALFFACPEKEAQATLSQGLLAPMCFARTCSSALTPNPRPAVRAILMTTFELRYSDDHKCQNASVGGTGTALHTKADAYIDWLHTAFSV